MDNNKDKEVQEFSNFIALEAKAKGKDPKAYAKELGEEGLKEAYKRFLASKKKLTQKALHGAKLNYFKSLKNQCAEDEEVVYYKKGGSVGCGCKKKEDGGQVKKAEDGWKAKFKARKMQSGDKTPEKDPTNGGRNVYDLKLKKYRPATKAELEQQRKNREDARRGEGEGNYVQPPVSKSEKIKQPKKASCGSKIKKHQEGSVIAKFKMHRLGGSLNGIPFIREEQ